MAPLSSLVAWRAICIGYYLLYYIDTHPPRQCRQPALSWIEANNSDSLFRTLADHKQSANRAVKFFGHLALGADGGQLPQPNQRTAIGGNAPCRVWPPI